VLTERSFGYATDRTFDWRGEPAMSIAGLVRRLFGHRRLLIVLLLVVTAGFGVGAAQLEETSSIDAFETESTASEKLEYVEGNFSAAENTTTAQVVVRDENVLDRETLLATIEYQRELRANETVNATLPDDAMASVANAVATAAITEQRVAKLRTQRAQLNRTEQALGAALERLAVEENASVEAAFARVRANSSVSLGDQQYRTFAAAAEALRTAETETGHEQAYARGTRGVLAPAYENLAAQQQEIEAGLDPSLAAQHEQLAARNATQIERLVGRVLAPDNAQVLALMPSDYEPGETRASATLLAITQDTGGAYVAPDSAPQEIIDAQYEMRAIAEDRPGEYVVFGYGITANEINSSMSDSLAVVGPLALLFVLVVLLIAYRDLLDIALGLFGIVTVLVWTFGFMGWTGIEFSTIFIAVPVLLIGLSIDYAIHVFMRGREARTEGDSVAEATVAGLAGVGLALVLVTVTAAVGFLSNLVSPITPIQQFGVVNAVGIVAALFVFGLLVPALKVEIDGFLESRGVDRRKSAFGTSGLLAPVLQSGAVLARRAPAVVLVVVLLVSAGGVYGGTQVDTSFDTSEFMAEEPPAWTESLPASMQPTEYTAASTIDYLDERFLRQEMQAQILLEGDPTSEAFLRETGEAEQRAANASTVGTLPNGEPAVRGPLSAMESVAAENATFNATLAAADTNGDGIPDSNIEELYDAFFAADEQAAADVLHRTEAGEYEAARVVLLGGGSATRGEVTEDTQAIAADLDDEVVTATATGEQTVVFHEISEAILDTVIESLLVTLLAVGLFLMVVTRITGGSATLGLVTTAPVVIALSWVLGTMYALGMSFNSITGMITSLTIGLGVAYSIHVSQRYQQQLTESDSVWDALATTVTGTGGALLGSAATTAGGFGVLTVSFVPSLQQFGFITAISIVYAFLASVFVLPTLLVGWTRLFGPEWARTEIKTGPVGSERPAATDDD
jgi:predicted RND superfamily exporter protein